MIVAEQHRVDGRKILPRYSRNSSASRADPRERTCAFGPDGVGQNIQALLLKQHRGMVHERSTQFSAFDSARRDALLDVGNETGRGLRPGSKLPPDQLAESEGLWRVRIIVALAVEVLREFSIARAIRHELSFIAGWRSFAAGALPAYAECGEART